MSKIIEPTHQAYHEIQNIDHFLTKCNRLFEDPYIDEYPSHHDSISVGSSMKYVEEFFRQHGCTSVSMKWIKEIISQAEGEDWSRLSRHIKDANNEFMGIERVYADIMREIRKKEDSYSKLPSAERSSGRNHNNSIRQENTGDKSLRLPDEIRVSTPSTPVQYIRNDNSERNGSTRRNHEEPDMYAHHSHRKEHISRQQSIMDDQLRSELRLQLEKINEPPTPQPYEFKDPEVMALEALTQRENKERKEKETMANIRQNNPNFADLSDNNRPSKIAERYIKLYDDLWTEAFEELTTLYNQHGKDERRVILDLAGILKAAFDFTSKYVDTQIERIAHQTRELMLDPCSDRQQESDIGDPFRYDKLLGQFAYVCIKDTADLSVNALQKHFRTHSFPKNAVRTRIADISAVKKYTDKCVELTWYMNVQDPPMVLVWPDMVELDSLTDYFRYYTASGKILDHEVWPALLLCKDGPSVVKGVAQFRKC